LSVFEGSAEADPASSQTVLVVEDDPIGRALLCEELRRAGYRLVEAETGEEAIQVLRDPAAAPIDWLFADIRLPGSVDGWVVGSEFRLTHPFRPIVYASAYVQNDRAKRLTPGSVFLEKPVRAAEVVQIFKALKLAAEISGGERTGSPGCGAAPASIAARSQPRRSA
jgi:CheY-like chemotaxis protein